MFANGVLVASLLIFLITVDASGLDGAITATHVNESEWKMVPMIEPERLEKMALNNTIRRRLGSFQLCAGCTCCGGSPRICLASACCYAISCNIPNRPFGYCSFTPKSCNCFHCPV